MISFERYYSFYIYAHECLERGYIPLVIIRDVRTYLVFPYLGYMMAQHFPATLKLGIARSFPLAN